VPSLEIDAHFVPDAALRCREFERQLREAAIHEIRAARQWPCIVAVRRFAQQPQADLVGEATPRTRGAAATGGGPR